MIYLTYLISFYEEPSVWVAANIIIVSSYGLILSPMMSLILLCQICYPLFLILNVYSQRDTIRNCSANTNVQSRH